jgi:hypothetical protein
LVRLNNFVRRPLSFGRSVKEIVFHFDRYKRLTWVVRFPFPFRFHFPDRWVGDGRPSKENQTGLDTMSKPETRSPAFVKATHQRYLLNPDSISSARAARLVAISVPDYALDIRIVRFEVQPDYVRIIGTEDEAMETVAIKTTSTDRRAVSSTTSSAKDRRQ